MTPDSEWVVSSSKDRTVHFWDPWTGQMQLRVLGHKNSVISVASSPAATRAGGLFATAGGDCLLRIWSYTRLDRTDS
jgi:glucose repression regulatory protein TUP1